MIELFDKFLIDKITTVIIYVMDSNPINFNTNGIIRFIYTYKIYIDLYINTIALQYINITFSVINNLMVI